MRSALTISALLHLMALLVAILGLPDPRDRLEMVAEPIPVEMVDIADITNTRIAEKPEPKPTPPPQPQPTPPEAAPPPPPVAEAQPEPPPPLPPPPPEQKPAPKPEPVPEKREPLKEMKVAIAPEPPKLELPKPEPLKKKPEKKLDLASVLKNLEKKPDTPQKPDPKPPEQKPQQQAQRPQSIDDARSDHLSMTEEDALRRQFMACWNPPIGAKGLENMTAEIRIFFDPQMRVQDVKFLGGNGSLSDPAYRSFMESAVRAPLKDACRTLKLPAEKYGSKGTIIMNFSPRDML